MTILCIVGASLYVLGVIYWGLFSVVYDHAPWYYSTAKAILWPAYVGVMSVVALKRFWIG